MAQWAIGIDGGGTKTTACLVNPEGIVVKRLTTSATNYSQQNEKEEEICSIIMKTLATLRSHAPDVDPSNFVIGVCLSGLGRADQQARLRKILESHQTGMKIVVSSDAVGTLYGAFGGDDGIILISGTGSIAFAKTNGKDILRCGGWGYLLGDEGSGFAIAKAGIAAALRDWEKRGPATRLRPAFEKEFAVESIQLGISTIYAQFATRGQLAGFAPLVFNCADQGDTVARKIVDQAAQDLFDLIQPLLVKFPEKATVGLALIGNIFKNERLKKNLLQSISSKYPGCKVGAPRFEPEHGAAIMALKEVAAPD